MKRESDITIVEGIETSIQEHCNHELLKDGGNDRDYAKLGDNEKSAKYCRRYRIYCSRYWVIRGHFDVLLEFDHRIGRGRLVIRDDTVAAFCKAINSCADYLWAMTRYFNTDRRR